MTVTIVKAVMTCPACPSQWDAWDGDGNFWYLRYRHAGGSAEQYAQGPGWYEDPDAAPVKALYFHRDDVDPMDGEITLEEFAQLAGLALAGSLGRNGET